MAFLRLLRLRLLLVAVVAAALLWWGQGLSLREGSAPAPGDTGVEGLSGESSGQDRTKPLEDATATRPEAEASGAPSTDVGVATGGEPPHDEGVPAVPDRPAAETPAVEEGRADADRRGAREALVRTLVEADRFSEALAMLDAVAGGEAELLASVRTALHRRLRALEQSVRAGSFHAARSLLASVGTGPEVRDALGSLAERMQWPQLVGTAGASPAATAVDPEPEPRLSGRLVRLANGGAVPARVLEVRGGKATLRVLGPLGVTFPSHSVHELEPDAVTADEAAELGLAALVAGDEPAARVWAAIACARGAARSARLVHLLERLPLP